MYKFLKRFLDIILSITVLPILLIFCIVVGIIIKIEDGGAIFYKSQRLGKDGNVFTMYKFRSMKEDAPDIRLKDGSTFNSVDDLRVTRVGKLLRNTSIDELPQILNILRGDMSIIGPRPDTPDMIMMYRDKYKKILNIRPGLTGINQAYFRNSITSLEKMDNDYYYSLKQTFAVDLKIFCKTLIKVFDRDNINHKNEEKQEKIIILGGGILQLNLIEKANQKGLETIVLDINENCPGGKLANKFYKISTNDREGVCKICEIEETKNLVTIATDFPTRTIGYVLDKLGGSSGNFDSAILATDKIRMIEKFSEMGVFCPRYCKIGTVRDLERVNFFPCVIKPSDSSGSRGVTFCQNYDDLYSNYNNTINYSSEKKALVEEFVDGDEYSVEGIVKEKQVIIIQITKKYTTGAPHFVETMHIQPAKLNKYMLRKVSKTVVKAVQSLEIKNSAFHAEFKIFNKEVKMIEIGARGGGDFISTDMVRQSTGIDFLNLILKLAINEPIYKEDLQRKFHRKVQTKFFTDVGEAENYIAKYKKSDIIDSKIIVLNDNFKHKSLESSLDRNVAIILTLKNKVKIKE